MILLREKNYFLKKRSEEKNMCEYVLDVSTPLEMPPWPVAQLLWNLVCFPSGLLD